MTTAAIRTCRLGKRYGRLAAVAEVSFRVERGEIYGFLGLNGAGKSTTIRMLLGMSKPSSGAAYLFGERVLPGVGPWHRVGYLVDGAHAYPRLTVRQNLELVARLRGVRDAAVDAVLDRLGIARYRDRRAGQLSQGNLQRLGLAKALLHRPDLLVLDEPANGLDPAGIVELRELLADLARAGTAVLVSSHILAEVARSATRIGIIDDGRLLTELDTADLWRRAERRLRVDARDRAAARKALCAAGLDVAAEHPTGLELADAWSLANPDQVAVLLAAAGSPPTTLHVHHEDLESYFLRLLVDHRPLGEHDAA